MKLTDDLALKRERDDGHNNLADLAHNLRRAVNSQDDRAKGLHDTHGRKRLVLVTSVHDKGLEVSIGVHGLLATGILGETDVERALRGGGVSYGEGKY